ncbi:MAG TPA: acyl-CoA-binding protein [Anaeromyxobacteraceae bacterium]|nr:acyl-CoA-binding protein [Anaeromyxobacteraceae bacterium]
MATEEEFGLAKERITKLSRRPSNADLLEAYGLFKQATEGDVRGSRPGILDPKGRAKFDAWASRKGMPAAEARAKYVALVERIVRSFG